MASPHETVSVREIRVERGAPTPQQDRLYSGVRGMQMLLRITFSLLPVIAGLDKFFGVLANWDDYLSPLATQVVPVTPHQFMMGVGVIEIVAGILTAVWPRVFGYVVMLWLWLIVANLIVLGEYYDVALRDLALSVGALALARLSQLTHSYRVRYFSTPDNGAKRVTAYAEPPAS